MSAGVIPKMFAQVQSASGLTFKMSLPEEGGALRLYEDFSA